MIHFLCFPVTSYVYFPSNLSVEFENHLFPKKKTATKKKTTTTKWFFLFRVPRNSFEGDEVQELSTKAVEVKDIESENHLIQAPMRPSKTHVSATQLPFPYTKYGIRKWGPWDSGLWGPWGSNYWGLPFFFIHPRITKKTIESTKAGRSQIVYFKG